MKYLSFRILALCIILPPLLYISSTFMLEAYLRGKYKEEIQAVMIHDTAPMLNGSMRIREAINRNIERFLSQHKIMRRAGIRLTVTVTTKDGELIYPSISERQTSSRLADPEKIARENFRILNQGLVLDVDVAIEGNTIISNLLLSIFVILSFIIMLYHYRKGAKQAVREEAKISKQIQYLARLGRKHIKKLDRLREEKEKLLSETETTRDRLFKIKQEYNENEEELLKEIIDLENKLKSNLAIQEKQEKEIEELKQQLSRYEQKHAKNGKGKRRSTLTERRFKSLYKNIKFHERAIEGYMNLEEDMQIKVEEIIFILNQDYTLVPVKRKVFGKKKAEKVLEVVFAYKGRLYYRRIKGNKIEILAIGTKNTQGRELEFLSRL